MSLTLKQIALFDIISDRILTGVNAFRRVPGMTEAEVDAEMVKWKTIRKTEMEELDGH